MWQKISNHISETQRIRFRPLKVYPIGGGCINETYQIKDKNQCYFVKLNNENTIDMLTAEADGLREIAATKTIRVPSPICLGVTNQKAYLVLEYISFSKSKSIPQKKLGKNLAKLHAIPQKKFGWHRNNHIGSNTQLNTQNEDWPEFFRKYRIEFQINLAKANGFQFNRTKIILNKTDDFFSDYEPKPALLHGDLWSGNFAFDETGTPFIFDPATYYGDREAEFGLTEMFGGFRSDFWKGYEEVLPLDQGFSKRQVLYRLYHTLNHLNLFGSSYANSVKQLINKLDNY